MDMLAGAQNLREPFQKFMNLQYKTGSCVSQLKQCLLYNGEVAMNAV